MSLILLEKENVVVLLPCSQGLITNVWSCSVQKICSILRQAVKKKELREQVVFPAFSWD
jgi:hypothetical protein